MRRIETATLLGSGIDLASDTWPCWYRLYLKCAASHTCLRVHAPAQRCIGAATDIGACKPAWAVNSSLLSVNVFAREFASESESDIGRGPRASQASSREALFICLLSLSSFGHSCLPDCMHFSLFKVQRQAGACRNWGVSPTDFQQLARLPALPETARNSCLQDAVAALEGGAKIPFGALESWLLVLASSFAVWVARRHNSSGIN